MSKTMYATFAAELRNCKAFDELAKVDEQMTRHYDLGTLCLGDFRRLVDLHCDLWAKMHVDGGA